MLYHCCLILLVAATESPSLSPEVLAADAALAELRRDTNVLDDLTPLNEASERRRFEAARKAGAFYEPCFEYEQLPADLALRLQRLGEWRAPEGPVGELLEGVRRELQLKCELVQARGTDRFEAIGAALYGEPAPETIALAEAWLALPSEEAGVGPALSREEVEQAMWASLKSTGLTGWTVRWVAEMTSQASVLPVSKVLKLNPARSFTREDVLRLAVHELGVHARRAEAAAALPLESCRSGFAGYLATEEGLALYLEEQAGVLTTLQRRRYAARAWAVAHRQLGFGALYERLRAWHLSADDAWTVCVRIKRGLVDTGRPGGFVKDHVYLSGYREVAAYVAAGGSTDRLLAAGKSPLRLLPAVAALLPHR
ncbi:MAG: DUF1704 domain-containing protein [Armatimonadetes bacterium]|nr:DUF1704 domain-containing protein [Armatimonadota bacterium]